MLSIFQHIFALKFVLVERSNGEIHVPLGVWHDDVQVFAAYDEDDDGAFLGWLYMDLYERVGKKAGAANYNLVPVRSRSLK